MSVLVFAENWDGKFKKATFEAVSYGAKVALLLNKKVVAVSVGAVDNEECEKLSAYGASKVLRLNDERLKTFHPSVNAQILYSAIQKEEATVVIIANTFSGKAIAGRLAAKAKAGIVAGVIELPSIENGFVVKKPVFSGKGYAYVNIKSSLKIVTLVVNAVRAQQQAVESQIEEFTLDLPDELFLTRSKEVKRETGKLSLTEAEIVVSGGRGMKGPQNWGMLEELAETLGAATACSKPVSDMDWRPHSEHVGQTGLTIRPNLYIAIGISKTIQHLAGVNSSKVIVVINKDREAPFFKAADYGIVGDAFDVVPKLTEAAKKLKAHS